MFITMMNYNEKKSHMLIHLKLLIEESFTFSYDLLNSYRVIVEKNDYYINL